MPHIIIEHSANISNSSALLLASEVKDLMPSVKSGNFDSDQCKIRNFSFDEYYVGNVSHESSSFIHITIKILSGRSLEARKELSKKVMNFAQDFFDKLYFSPSDADKIISIGEQVIDLATATPYINLIQENSDLAGKRCDISVDIVEMDKETYQKDRTE